MKRAKRVLAWIGIAVMAALYILTIVFAVMKSPASKNFLMAAIFCTIAVPVIIYAMQMVARHLSDYGNRSGNAYRASGSDNSSDPSDDPDNDEN